MNVTELARRLRITPNKLREVMPQLGFDIGVRAIKVDPKMAQAILDKLSDSKIRHKYLEDDVAKGTKKIEEGEENKGKGDAKMIKIPGKIVVKELAKRMSVPVTNLMLELMKNGVMASLNQSIDFETASIIVEDMGFKAEKSEEESESVVRDVDYEKLLKIDYKTAKPRPPVVVIMGHVDHGKTKLLDAIRQTNVVEGEAGGITQHIGAYQVEKDGRLLTFVDTPGHEAFSAMRSRGAQVADIAILLVAADDGVQPQTIEAVAHIRQAGLPFIVAINKIDKPGANIDKVKSDLANIDLTPEDWGGKTVCVEISAKKQINISELLETLFLVADIDKDKIVANEDREAVGTIIESHIDKGEGPVATVLVHNGILKRGDLVKIGEMPGKIRTMRNWKNKIVEQAMPSMPVRILGFKNAPLVGEIFQVVKDRKELKGLGRVKREKGTMIASQLPVQTDSEKDGEVKKPQVKLILKTDVLGSTEAIIESLEKISQDKVDVCIVKQGLGNITEKDVETAEGLGAHLVGFHVKLMPEAKKLAGDSEIEVQIFDVIYDLLSFIEEEVKKIAGKEKVIKEIGKLRVLVIFRTGKGWQVVGGDVAEGKVMAGVRARLIRGDEMLGELKIIEVESGKEKVSEVVAGQQAGLKVEGDVLVEEGDGLEIFSEEEK